MANIDIGNILKSVEDQSKVLAEKLFKQYTHQALSDVRDFMEKSKNALTRWVEDLVRGDIDKDELESLTKGQADRDEMRAIKQTSSAASQNATFTNVVSDIIIKVTCATIT